MTKKQHHIVYPCVACDFLTNWLSFLPFFFFSRIKKVRFSKDDDSRDYRIRVHSAELEAYRNLIESAKV